MRQALPARRRCETYKAQIGGQSVYVTLGRYDDGALGEVFLDVNKVGTTLKGFAIALGRTISLALQHGASAFEVAGTLKGIDFEPNGEVQNGVVSYATSIVDYVAQLLEGSYDN